LKAAVIRAESLSRKMAISMPFALTEPDHPITGEFGDGDHALLRRGAPDLSIPTGSRSRAPTQSFELAPLSRV